MIAAALRQGMMGASGYTAKDYVQNGLVAMWDGIENAGFGVHDPNATVWKDLVGRRNLTLAGGIWVANGLSTDDKRVINQDGGWTNPSDIGTVEAVATPVSIGQYAVNLCIFSSGIYFSYGGYNQTTRSLHIRMDESRIYASARSKNTVAMPEETFTATAIYDDSVVNDCAKLYIGGNEGVYKPSSVGAVFYPGRIAIGTTGHTVIDNCIRIYNRALAAAEIAANYEIDKARFNLPETN